MYWIISFGLDLIESDRPKDAWKEPRKKKQEVRCRPQLELLERRELLACTQEGAPPWCRDLDFDLDGQTKGDIPFKFEEARAMIIQQIDIDPGPGVNLQDRALLGGHALSSLGQPPPGSDTALIRLCPNGGLDNGFNCYGNGFGDINPLNGKGRGYKVINFYSVDSPTDPFEEEIITALAIQPNQHSDTCDAAGVFSDKIIAAVRAPVKDPPPASTVQDTIGLVRYCGDGRLDTDQTNWKSGQHPDWHDTPSYLDPVGMITIGFADNLDDHHDFSRDVWPFALAVETLNPTNKRIVVGGYGLFPKSSEKGEVDAEMFSFFVLARMCEDGHFDDGNHSVPTEGGGSVPVVGHCGAEGFGENITQYDTDRGRIHFDGDGNYDANHIKNQVRGIQLVQNDPTGVDFSKWDILMAGPDQLETEDHRNFFVARIDHDGKASAQGNPPWDWQTFVKFYDVVSPPEPPHNFDRDDIATDLVYRATGSQLIVAGVSCAKSPATACIEDPLGDSSLGSDIAFVRLDISGATPTEFYKKRLTQGLLGSGTHTDVAYSVVLQPHPDEPTEPPLVVIGGYSVRTNGATPYMSGIRVDYDDPDEVNYDHFRSNFPTTKTGQIGDQAWEIGIQQNNRIVAGGFHEDTSSQGLVVAAMRVCRNPNENPCDGSAGIGSGGGGDSTTEFQPPVGSFVGWVDSRSTAYVKRGADSLSATVAIEDSPAPPLPNEEFNVEGPNAVEPMCQVTVDRQITEDLLEPPLQMTI